MPKTRNILRKSASRSKSRTKDDLTKRNERISTLIKPVIQMGAMLPRESPYKKRSPLLSNSNKYSPVQISKRKA